MKNDNWISVEDRLPENEIEVLVFGEYVEVGYRRNKRWKDFNGEYINNNPTHWQPLPKPPKVNE